MKITYKLSIILIAITLLSLAFPHPVQAAASDKLVIGGNYTLESGETLDEQLVIIGGSVILEADSTVNGGVVILGGSLQVEGTVNGDITGAGGYIELADTAVVSGNISTAGVYLDQHEDALVTGEVNTTSDSSNIEVPGKPRFPGTYTTGFDPFFNLVGFFLRVALWALLAMVVVMFTPAATSRIARTAASQPLMAGGLGLLTVVVLPIVLVAIALTILLIPVSLVGVLLLVLAWAYGVIVLGTELGKRIAGIFSQEWHPAIAAGLGTLLLVLVVDGIAEVIPCLGWMPQFLVGIVGLGAVLLTRFGTQAYPPAPIPIPASEPWPPILEQPAPEATSASQAASADETPPSS